MKMKNKLTNKFLAVAIILVSLNAFSIAITPFSEATIGTPEMAPVFSLKDKPLEIAGEIE
jgi:hypothetical protein